MALPELEVRSADSGAQATADGSTAGDGMAAVAAEEYEAIAKRLQRDEELIKQLKHIVKAQHGKIEEFREMLEVTSSKSALISSYEAEDFKKAVESNQELHQQIHRLQAELAKYKAENSSLKKVNRRLKGLLHSDSSGWQMSTQSDMPPPPSECLPEVPALASTAPERSWSKGPLSVNSGRTELLGRLPLGSLTCRGHFNRGRLDFDDRDRSSSRSPPRRQDEDARKQKVPQFSRVSQLVNSMNLLWRDFESALSCLRATADVAARLLADRRVANITVFMVDPWLRKAVTAPLAKSEQLTIFYLGQGKTELQVLLRLEESKVCPPLFTDLQALPFRSRTGAALPVLTPNRSRVWAVLQVTLEDSLRTEATPVPRVLQDAGVSQDPYAASQCFTDSHVSYLQLLCSFMGGVLLHVERLEQRAKVVERTRSILEAAMDVNKAKTLADFEQRVKHMLSGFFSVSTIRILFYDPENKALLLASSQMRKKGATSIGAQKGILGQCAQKQQVINIPDIHQNPFVDPMADGLQRSGRPVGAHAGMLVGPMLVETSERSGHELLGVVQLLEKKRRAADGSQQPSEFTLDEQQLFSQLLTVCSHAGSRTIRVQQLAAQINGTPNHVQALLCG